MRACVFLRHVLLSAALSAFLPLAAAHAAGINSSGPDLPIGAGGKTTVSVTSDGTINFKHPDTGVTTAWIDTKTGKSSFDTLGVGLLTTYLSANATGVSSNVPVTVSGGKLTINAGGGANSADIIAANRIQTGDQVNGGGGILVGPSMFIGSRDATTFGFWSSGTWNLVVKNNGNVGIGKDPTTKLDVNGNVNASTMTLTGATASFDANKLDTIANLEGVPVCSAGEGLQKTGAKTFACVSLAGATATTGLPFDGVMRYRAAQNDVQYFDQATASWQAVGLNPTPPCPDFAHSSRTFTATGSFTPPAGVSASCPLTVRVLVVGGGGNGGNGGPTGSWLGGGGGGGGSGRVSAGTVALNSSSAIPVTVGGSGGGNSSFNGIVANGGANGSAGQAGIYGAPSAGGGAGGAGAGGGGGGGTGCGQWSGAGGYGGRISGNGMRGDLGGGGGTWCSQCNAGFAAAGTAQQAAGAVTATTVSGVVFSSATFAFGAGGGEANGCGLSGYCSGSGGSCASGTGGGSSGGAGGGGGYPAAAAVGYGAGGGGGGGGSGGGGGGGGGGGLMINGSGVSAGQGTQGGPGYAGSGGAGAPGVVYIEW